MDQGLKERLIGAAVLVALGVWLIPWVLNGPEETHETQATSLALPSPDEPLPVKSQTLDLRRDDVADAAPAVEESGGSDVAPAAAELSPPGAAVAAAAAAAPSRDADPNRNAVRPAELPRPVESAQTAPAPTPAPSKPAAPSAKAAAVAAAAGAQQSTTSSTGSKTGAAPAATGGWAVQLGSFGEEENARRLASRAKTYGYKADVSSFRAGSRSLYRVRVGPMAARGEADAAASALGAHGFVAQVVALD